MSWKSVGKRYFLQVPVSVGCSRNYTFECPRQRVIEREGKMKRNKKRREGREKEKTERVSLAEREVQKGEIGGEPRVLLSACPRRKGREKEQKVCLGTKVRVIYERRQSAEKREWRAFIDRYAYIVIRYVMSMVVRK